MVYTIEGKMLMIQSMTRDVAIRFSDVTQLWYVTSNIEIGDGSLLSSISEHADTPGRAVRMFFKRITNLEPNQFLVVGSWGDRKHFTWNGAAFVGQPV